jgi:hypothetical protein
MIESKVEEEAEWFAELWPKGKRRSSKKSFDKKII